MPGIELRFSEHQEHQDDKLQELCRQYWALGQQNKFINPITTLEKSFSVPRAKIVARVNEICSAFATDEICRSCGSPRGVTSRAEYLRVVAERQWSVWTCYDCKRRAHEDAEREAKRLREEQWRLVDASLQASRAANPLDTRRLTFTDAIYLLALSRAGGAEDLSFIRPRDAFAKQLSPTVDLDRAVLDHLYKQGIISVHPGSNEKSIIIEAGRFAAHYPFLAHYTLPLSADGPSPSRFIEDLEQTIAGASWPDEWTAAESAELHRLVATHECLAFLKVGMEEHGFEARLGEKTTSVIRAALAKYSIGQVYSFIWRAVRDVAAYYLRERISKQHATNIIPGSIQRLAERASAENWNVSAYRRNFKTEESVISHVLFTVALRLPNGGLGTVPPASEFEAEG